MLREQHENDRAQDGLSPWGRLAREAWVRSYWLRPEKERRTAWRALEGQTLQEWGLTDAEDAVGSCFERGDDAEPPSGVMSRWRPVMLLRQAQPRKKPPLRLVYVADGDG